MIVALPAATPLTTPELFTVAIVVAPELQVPPVVASPNDILPPGHTKGVPVIAAAEGNGLTVTVMVESAVPQLLLTS